MHDVNEYQEVALSTFIVKGDENDIPRVALGLSDEAGEVAGAVKKHLRGDYGRDELRERLRGELGDVCWYLAVLSDLFDLPLSEILQHNADKLASRAARGTIQGDGEHR